MLDFSHPNEDQTSLGKKPVSLSKKLSIVIVSAMLVVLTACQGDAKSKQATNTAQATDAAPASDAVTVVEESVQASGENAVAKLDDPLAAVVAKFVKARPDLKIASIEPTGAKDVYLVSFEGKGSVYILGTAGEFFFVGDLYHLDGDRIVNVTEKSKYGMRAELMASIKQDDMIVFSPEGEVKASVVVFTDVDCGYCRKLHREVPAMNALGIEIKYLAYPRAGIGSPSYNKIASAWCADDRNEALSKLKAGETIPNNVCDGNPVAEQFKIGIRAGLNGTPAIILESGELIPGYLSAEKLAQTLGI